MAGLAAGPAQGMGEWVVAREWEAGGVAGEESGVRASVTAS